MSPKVVCKHSIQTVDGQIEVGLGSEFILIKITIVM